MARGRSGHFSAALAPDDVLVIGGPPGSPIAEFFDPLTATFSSSIGSPVFNHDFGAGTVLPDGRPFMAGGQDTLGVTVLDPVFGFLGAINLQQSEVICASLREGDA